MDDMIWLRVNVRKVKKDATKFVIFSMVDKSDHGSILGGATNSFEPLLSYIDSYIVIHLQNIQKDYV